MMHHYPMCRLLLAGVASWLITGSLLTAASAGTDVDDVVLKQLPASAGLALVVGTGDVKTLEALAAGSKLAVEGVVAERDRATQWRHTVAAGSLAGRVSVTWRRTAHLPYQDGLVNFLLICGWGGPECKGLTLADAARVLCPGGVAVIGTNQGGDAKALLAEAASVKLIKAEKLERPGSWIRMTKLMNPDFDDCPNYRGGPLVNMVSNDKVFAPGKEVRWCNGPTWAAATYLNNVAAAGRIFHMERRWLKPDQGVWDMVARDAYNGCELWRTPGDPTKWESNQPLRALCADATCLYMGAGDNGVEVVDAATGKKLRKIGDKQRWGYVTTLSTSGIYMLVGTGNLVRCVNLTTDAVVWSRSIAQPANKTGNTHPPMADGMAYVLGKNSLEAVALADGKSLWTQPVPEPLAQAPWQVSSAGAGAVYVVNGIGNIAAFNSKTGAALWSYNRQLDNLQRIDGVDFFPYPDAVYLNLRWTTKDKKNLSEYRRFDALTGKETGLDGPKDPGGIRCWVKRATGRFLPTDGECVFIDRTSFAPVTRGGVRPQCGSGPIFAYGLEYDAPHVCSCRTSIRGEVALSGGGACPKGEVTPSLIPGVAAVVPQVATAAADWPMYRADTRRSNSAATVLPAKVKQLWSAQVGGGALSQATGVGNRLFVADPTTRRVLALDRSNGKTLWSFAAEGRVSIAPAWTKGRVLFGDHAGWVYAVDASTGKLLWQLQAAPEQKYLAAYNRFESVWPVKSDLLPVGDSVYGCAVRSSTLDGGVHLFALNPEDGSVRWHKAILEAGNSVQNPPDLWRADDKVLHFSGSRVDPATGGYSTGGCGPVGMLQTGNNFQGTLTILDMLAPHDPGQIYLRKFNPADGRNAGDNITFDKVRSVAVGNGDVNCKGASTWVNKETHLHMLTLLLAGDRVYAAGTPYIRDAVAEKPALCVFSSQDGKLLQTLPLDAAPAIDGLSAVGGNLILTTQDGRVACYAAE